MSSVFAGALYRAIHLPAVRPGMLALCATAMLAVSASPGAAETAAPAPTPDMPDVSRRQMVINVAKDDVLNVRAQPDASAEIITTLPPYSRNVIIAGTRHESGKEIWWQVVTPAGTGWVNARYLAPDEPSDTSFPVRCTGTEPFWNITTANGEAQFSTPDSQSEWTAGQMEWARGSMNAFIIRLKKGDAPGQITAFRTGNACSDGMSDTAFPFHGVLTGPDGSVYSGCCQRGG